MGRFAPLPLRMHDGRPLPHTFFEGDGAGLLIIFPGLHYGPEGPLLYHLSKQLQGSGGDTLFGKSLGTIVLVQLCSGGVVPDKALVAQLTPPIGSPQFDSAFAATRQPTYIAIGTADSFYSEPALAELQARRPVLVRVVKGADHGMDVAGDLTASLRAVGQVVEDTAAFFLTGKIPGLEGVAA